MEDNDQFLQAADAIWAGVRFELATALEKWGADFDNKNTPNDWAAYVCRYVGEAIKMNRQTKRFDAERFKSNMEKAAGLAIAALLAFRRLDGRLPKRHYDE